MVTFEEKYGFDCAQEIKRKISLAGMGRVQSEETRKKKSLASTRALRGRKLSEETKRKIGDKSRGRHHSEETKRRIGEAGRGAWPTWRVDELKKRWQDPIFRERMSGLTFRGGRHTEGAKEAIRMAHIGKPISEAVRKRLSMMRKGVPTGRKPVQCKDTREKISKRLLELWRDKEYVTMMLRALRRSPSKLEMRVNGILEKNFPGAWRFTGDKSVWFTVDGKHYNPDFLDTQGRRLVIEFNGWYMHTGEEEKAREGAFNKLGLRTLFLYPADLVDEAVVVGKVLKFMGCEE